MEELAENGCLQFEGDEFNDFELKYIADDSPFDATVRPELLYRYVNKCDLQEFCRAIDLYLEPLFTNHLVSRHTWPLAITLVGREDLLGMSVLSDVATRIYLRAGEFMLKHKHYFVIRLVTGNESWFHYIRDHFEKCPITVKYIPRGEGSVGRLCDRMSDLLNTDAVIALPGGRMTSVEANLALEAGMSVLDLTRDPFRVRVSNRAARRAKLN